MVRADILSGALVGDPDQCWPWQMYVTPEGYGTVHIRGEATQGAHRVSYEVFCGPIPSGFEVDHLCRNRSCINPAHLEAVTSLENSRRVDMDAVVARRLINRTHCKRGHPFDEGNTYTEPGGRARSCRTCKRLAMRTYRSRAREMGFASPFKEAK